MSEALAFVVNGEDVVVKVNGHEPLEAARNKALAQSKNTGRPPNEWELRTAAGTLIGDVTRPIDSYGFAPGERLYLTLRVGAGGAFAA